MIKDFFETASFHLVKPCNMACKFCYATFQDFKVTKQLSAIDSFNILSKLKDAGLQKITFAGGEPLLYKYLYEVIEYAKNIGLVTSIITNGSLLTNDFMQKCFGKLDWIGVSIDSIDFEKNRLIGRVAKNNPDYFSLIKSIKDYGFKLKINTVVNKHNEDEDMNVFIKWANPSRWKVFDALKVEGQNGTEYDNIKASDGGFERFVERHKNIKVIVPESNELMTSAYLLIDPLGRLFEDTKGKHTYSDPLQDNPIEHCLSQISLNREMFEKRGGIYNW